MDLQETKLLAENLIRENGLNDWTFRFDRAVRRLGYCQSSIRTISLSAPLVVRNDETIVRNTILHEIAHALAGHKAGHGPQWKAIARQVGANPTACVTANLTEAPYALVCTSCGFSIPRHRRTNTRAACPECCKKFKGGKFSEDYLLQLQVA